MEPQNQYFYGRNERPPPMRQQQQPQDAAFPAVNNMDHSEMGPMMRALTEDLDMGEQNSNTSYPQQQAMPSMPRASGGGDQQRLPPTNNFGPASQTLSGYASQYSSGPGSHNYFGGGGHGPPPTPPLNSGFTSPSGNYPPGGMGGPYSRQMPGSSPLGSPNGHGHGHSYPRSASAGPTIPSPVMMHNQGMYSHNQSSPGNRTNTPFAFPPSPTSPHNHLNHASPPLASPSGIRPGGNLHSPKSVPASSPVPYVSAMSPPASRAQSVPTLPGNSMDHLSSGLHSRSKSPGSAGIHRPYPQQMSQQQQLYMPSPKVRPVDQTDSRGQYVELVHSKPPREQFNQNELQKADRSRNTSGPRKVTEPGHLQGLEDMVAVLGDSNVKETLDEIVSDKNLTFSENGAPETVSTALSNQNAHSGNNEKRTPKNGEKVTNSTDKVPEGLLNGFVDKDITEGKGGPVNGLSGLKHDETVPVKKESKKNPGNAQSDVNGRIDASKETLSDTLSSTNNVNTSSRNDTHFKSPVARPSKPQNSVQTKEERSSEQEIELPVASDSKCQNVLTEHSVDSEPAQSVPSTSTPNELDVCVSVKQEQVQNPHTPPFNNPMTTPTSKKNSPDDSGSSTGNDSLPLKKRRGRPPGSKTKRDDEEGKPRRRYSKKKKLQMDELDGDQNKPKQGKMLGKQKGEPSAQVIRGPILRVQGSSIDSVVSCHILNTPDAEEETLKNGKKKPKNVTKHGKRHGSIVSGNMGHAAVLATECTSPTGLWVCAFCGNPPNFDALGDLYGPYHPPGSDVHTSKRERTSKGNRHHGSHSRDSQQSRSRDGRLSSGSSKRSRSQEGRGQKGKSLMAREAQQCKNRKWRQVKTYMDDMGLVAGRKSMKRRLSEAGDDQMEVWIHEECAVWSQGVIFFQGALYGIHEAVTEADSKKCSLCRDTGASIGCLNKGCKQVYHYLCAIEAECQMHLENYSMTCPKHKDKKIKMRGAP